MMTKTYLVVYEVGEANLSGFAPDVPGCISTARDLPEMRRMMREALEFHLNGLASDGDPIPEAVTSNVDFSQDRPEHGVNHCIVEWLEVNVPQYEYQASA
jgi:predicted RNase H-like HicB family nuclease